MSGEQVVGRISNDASSAAISPRRRDPEVLRG
jgi:hypothetical protein